MRITVACHEAHIPDARQLAMALGFGPADADTYSTAGWQDGQGNRYACASFEARPEWIMGAQSPLTRPDWDTDQIIDMEGAIRAQAALVFSTVPILAGPNVITAIGGPEGVEALQSMGLFPANDEGAT